VAGLLIFPAGACERHQLDEAAKKRVFGYVPKVLSELCGRFDKLNQQISAAVKSKT
jgi:hypothetical protein